MSPPVSTSIPFPLRLRRTDELHLEARTVGGLLASLVGIVEIEDDFAGEANHRLAHVLHREITRVSDGLKVGVSSPSEAPFLRKADFSQ